MTRRYRRDLIGHFIHRQQRTQQPCTHACCRGYRVHPANMPVILPSRTLRRATDEDIRDHFMKISRMDSPKARRAEAQLLHEMERRDQAAEQQRERQARRERQRQAHREAVEAGRAARKMEREAETERIYRQAEEATRGNWVNAKGRARGISDREILTGRPEVFVRYASDEAKEYFADHPRPTAAYFRGEDTTVPYSHPSTRRSRRRASPVRRFTRRDIEKGRRAA